MPRFPVRFLVAALAAVLALACVDPKNAGGDTGDTALYVHSFETGQGKIYVFGNVAGLFSSNTSPAVPSRTITSDLLDQTLAWGGLVLDSSGNRLYVVGDSGRVVRIDHLRSQDGVPTSQDILAFELGSSSSDRLSGGKFGQAAYDSSSGTLYVTEANDTETRIWSVSHPENFIGEAKIPYAGPTVPSGDKACTGVAVGDGSVYAYFNDGSNLISGPDTYSGPRIRRADSGAFISNDKVVIGPAATLGLYGSLAYDTGNTVLFMARHNNAASATGKPILTFKPGKFTTGSFNQAPSGSFGDPATQGNLRVIAHPGNRDWLAGLTSNTANVGNATLWLWQNPAGTSPAAVQRLVPGAGECRGIALDGNN